MKSGREDGLFVALMLFGVEAGEISEGGACELLEWDRVEFRDHRQKALALLRRTWQEWRGAHPVEARR
jgi:hypothetical protein